MEEKGCNNEREPEMEELSSHEKLVVGLIIFGGFITGCLIWIGIVILGHIVNNG